MCYNTNMAKKQKTIRIKARYVVPVFILAFCVMGGIRLSQRTKMNNIEEQRVQLQEQYDALKVDEERLERMLEYMQTDDYLLQYAREKLGYVFPNDVKFRD